jgi:catechol 2,3-dioxygenase-like lactoylglutathione lyase family enzyme
MSVRFYHLQINVSNLDFYRALLLFLGFRIIDEGRDHLGFSDGHFALWAIKVESACRDLPFHRKAVGMNHLALRVGRREDVERFCREFLEKKGIVPLYGGAREYPEYRPGYFAVYFEDPDRIKLEVVYVPEMRGA